MSIYVLILFILSYILLDQKRLTVTPYLLSSPKLNTTYTLIQLTDLHGNHFGKQNKRLIQTIQKQQPDLIVLTGDMINGNYASSTRLLNVVDALSSTCPIYFVRGNHELAIKLYASWYDTFEQLLAKRGVIILENNAITHKDLTLYGLEVPLSRYAYVPKMMLEKASTSQSEALLNLIPTDSNFSVALCHTPFLEDVFETATYDVILSGHVHGGAIRLPGVGGLLSPERKFFPKYDAGVYELPQSKLIVSRGLGSGTTLPLRVFNPPEIVVLTLQPEKK